MVNVSAELTVHPARRERFMLHCRHLPMALQHCASPFYRQDHPEQCDAAQETGGATAGEHWSAMFDVLRDDESVTQPPP